MSRSTNWKNELDMFELSVLPTVGKNEFGRPMWIFPIDRTRDGRVPCPYCRYAGQRVSQTKNHFLQQHLHFEYGQRREDPTHLYSSSPTDQYDDYDLATPPSDEAKMTCLSCNSAGHSAGHLTEHEGISTSSLRLRSQQRLEACLKQDIQEMTAAAQARETAAKPVRTDASALKQAMAAHVAKNRNAQLSSKSQTDKSAKTEEPMDCVEQKSVCKEPPTDDVIFDNDEEFEELVKEVEPRAKVTQPRGEKEKPLGLISPVEIPEDEEVVQQATNKLRQGQSVVQVPRCCHHQKK